MILNTTQHVVTIGTDVTDQWQLSNDVFEGTHRLRQRKIKYLPKLEGESKEAYEMRLKRAVLKNKYKKTLTKAVANLLKNGITTTFAEDNEDGKGTNLKAFLRKTGVRAVKFGISYVLVDTPSFEGEPNTLEKELYSIKPYFSILDNLAVTEIKYSILGSTIELQYFEFKTTLPEYEGELRKVYELFAEGDTKVVQWRIEKEEGEGKERRLLETGIIDIPIIPIVPVYGSDNDDVFVNTPPYLDLAYYNLMHFQATSDAGIAHFVAATPMLFMRDSSSSKRDEKGNVIEDKVNISPWSVIKTSANDSEVSWVETQGSALTQHREWLKHIEEDMDELSMNLNLQAPDATATANNLQAADNQAGIEFVKDELERAARMLIRIVSIFDESIPIGEFEINAVGIGTITPEQIATIETLHGKGLISDEAYVEVINKTLPFDVEYDEDAETETEDNENPNSDPNDEELEEESQDNETEE
ncbi:DUF4055 domain-containing protein [Vibrio sp.]|uniref:DUF4055 domain-containing protein n=1 Tax=Vibrio sp. TaxID=678 RepID=UPI0037A60AC2